MILSFSDYISTKRNGRVLLYHLAAV